MLVTGRFTFAPALRSPRVRRVLPTVRVSLLAMRVQSYPWDGTTTDAVGNPEPNFDEMSLNTPLTQGVSTAVDVGTGNIPDNTPTTGYLRIATNDATPQYFLWEYSDHDGDDGFTMVGTAPFSANVSNNVMRAPVDEIAGGTQVSWTAVLGTPDQWLVVGKRGGDSPLKPALATGTFPYDITLQPQSDA